MSPLPQLFVVPPQDAPPSGGNRYNDGLIAALGSTATRCELAQLTPERLDSCSALWLDSLYLEHAPALREQLPARVPLRLVAHSLPSLLHEAAGLDAAVARSGEQEPLARLDGALATSLTMRDWLAARGACFPVWVVEPATEHAPVTRQREGQLRALVVANLIPNKGVLPLLQALRSQLEARASSAPTFSLNVVGSRETDPVYARACADVCAASSVLAASVELVGTASYEALLGELGGAHVLLSASRVESYGMAIADARAAGCVVLARRGGHVEQLVSVDAGGELVDDDDALVSALLRLVDHRGLLHARLHAAARSRLPARGWDDVARELCAALASGTKSPPE